MTRAAVEVLDVAPGVASAALADRLDNIILVTGLLLSPMYSVLNMRDVAGTPTLCVITYAACAMDACGLLASLFCRLRLRILKSQNRDEQYAQKLSGCRITSALSLVSPMVLLASAMLLLLITLSGSLILDADRTEVFQAAVGVPQLVLLVVGGSFLVAHGSFVLRSS
ncbi:hypothetical protein PsYK624_047780 [Phanerochaete sordida]|uniref:Uncharacterized protein n=1 Tax=Phanerochaete sordida TaxID=48140 RepID=A0A9P3G712_9APHY|nr:hypothetical protein PsYK624_047780 [Phanerochaete sordida]